MTRKKLPPINDPEEADQARRFASPLYPEPPAASALHSSENRRLTPAERQLAMRLDLEEARAKPTNGGITRGEQMQDGADEWRIPGLAIADWLCMAAPISRAKLVKEICAGLKKAHIVHPDDQQV